MVIHKEEFYYSGPALCNEKKNDDDLAKKQCYGKLTACAGTSVCASGKMAGCLDGSSIDNTSNIRYK